MYLKNSSHNFVVSRNYCQMIRRAVCYRDHGLKSQALVLKELHKCHSGLRLRNNLLGGVFWRPGLDGDIENYPTLVLPVR